MQKTLSFLITELYREFSLFCNQKLQGIGLTRGLMYLVLYIDKHPSCSPGQLADKLHLDMGHTARSLDKLERDGFVLRVKNAQDKRAYCLCLTEKGGRAMLTIRHLLVEWDEMKHKEISSEEAGELLRILGKLEHGNGGLHHV